MSGVIYADVLVVINFYVTYFLLSSTALLCREKLNRLRLFFSSLFGGFYALSILIPAQYKFLMFFFRIGAMILPVLITFGFRSLKAFLRLNVCFLVCNFIFAGLMLALWYFVCPPGMYFNGSVVYFDIDIMTLVILTVVCYVFLKLFDVFFKSRAPVNTVFWGSVVHGGKSFPFKAFLDTGNNLCDSFTGKPVIVLNSKAFSDELETFDESGKIKTRFILCSTLSGKSLLPAFSPERVNIKGAETEFTTDNVMIALTEEKLLNGEYDAILPMGLFQNKSDRKDEREREETFVVAEKDESRLSGKIFSGSGVLRQRTGESSSTADKGKGE